jgi:hypothetical protein
MRGIALVSLLAVALALALACACATSSPIQMAVGSSGSGGGGTGGSGGAPASCDVSFSDATCNACLSADCCTEADDCNDDSACVNCVGEESPDDTCSTDPPFVAFAGCLQSRCADACARTGGSTSSGGGGAIASGSGGSATASSSSATSTSSSSSSVSSSTSSTSSSSSGGTPLTCEGADGGTGCCDANGVLWFCDTMQMLYEQPCMGGTVCGWNAFHGYYDCVAPPGGADPSDTYPIACGGS